MSRSTAIRYIPAGLALALLLCVSPVRSQAGGESPHVPTVDDLLKIKPISEAKISPDGAWVAYSMTETDFQKDDFITHIWLVDVATGRNIQLTRGENSCSGQAWSPDGKWLLFLSDRVEGKSQIFAIAPSGGEAVRLTNAETGVSAFKLSPDGTQIAFTAADPVAKAMKDRKEIWDDYKVVGKDHGFVHLWTVDVLTAMNNPQAGKRRTEGRDFSVSAFSWSPDGNKIAFSATRVPDLSQLATEDIYVLTTAADSVKKIVSQPGRDTKPVWSPDGKQIVFNSDMGNANFFALNSRLALVPAEGGPVHSITDTFDESAYIISWTQNGIYFGAFQKTAFHLFRIDSTDLRIERITGPDRFLGMPGGDAFSFSRDGKRMAFISGSETSLPEVGISGFPFKSRPLTRMNEQAKDLVLGTRELISWKSKDGTEIEGVLIKPSEFRSLQKTSLALHPPRRPYGNRLPDFARTGHKFLSRGHLGGPRRPDPQGELSRKRGIRRKIPPSQYAQSGRRRRLGRHIGS